MKVQKRRNKDRKIKKEGEKTIEKFFVMVFSLCFLVFYSSTSGFWHMFLQKQQILQRTENTRIQYSDIPTRNTKVYNDIWQPIDREY